MINVHLGDQTFQWQPKDDITAYELVCCTGFLLLANLVEPYHVKEQELIECFKVHRVRRHFVDVTAILTEGASN